MFRRALVFCGRGGGEGDGGDNGRGRKKKEMDALSIEEDIDFSTSFLPLPSLGATSRQSKLHRFIVSPYDRSYRCWETFLVLLAFYTVLACSFEFGFLTKPKVPLDVVDSVVNVFFTIDIILTFFVAYLDKGLLVDDHKKIALRYLKTRLIFDVISTVPYKVDRLVCSSLFKSYGIFTLLRLCRLRRVNTLFSRMEKDRNYSYFGIRCLKLICVNLFSVHCAACIIYLLAEKYNDPKNTWIKDFQDESLWLQYVRSLYRATTTSTTTGYGDLLSVNSWEMIFDITYMVYNIGLNAYLIGNMANFIVETTSRTSKFRDTIQAASSFAQRNDLPVRLQNQILAHLSLRYRTDLEGLQQQEVIGALPQAMKSSISQYLFNSLINQVYLFHGVSEDLRFQLAAEMKPEYFPPEEDVILQNEIPTDMYILVTGAVELIKLRNGIEQAVGVAKTGGAVGEIGVICHKPQPFTARTKKLSQLLRLNRTAFLNIVQANARDGTIIMNNLLQYLKDFEDPLMEEVLTETEHSLAKGRVDLPLSLCFAAARQEDLLLHRLLKRGPDTNELDINGRTALHIAASRGSERCVVRLLEYGADPNIKDLEGIVPLWEAMLGKHESVVKILVDHGALILAGDVGRFTCTAIEQNNLSLLADIVRYGGNVTQASSSGTTPLHTAIHEGNSEIVQFLLCQGAEIDKPDINGLTPRALAERQGHENILVLFKTRHDTKKPPGFTATKEEVRCLRKHDNKYSSKLSAFATLSATSTGATVPHVPRLPLIAIRPRLIATRPPLVTHPSTFVRRSSWVFFFNSYRPFLICPTLHLPSSLLEHRRRCFKFSGNPPEQMS